MHATIADTRPVLDFWFDFGSNYSYLSVMRIEGAARAAGVVVHWRPFLLGPIFRSLGWETSPFVLQKQKGEYVWRDMARQCRKHGLAWQRPSTFPRSAVLAHRLALLGAREPWIGAFCRAVMQRNFAFDLDIDSADAVRAVLAPLGLPADALIAQASAEETKLRLRRQTEEAAALGIFGAPTFFADGEMFWGNDRLDDALAFCAGAQRVADASPAARA